MTEWTDEDEKLFRQRALKALPSGCACSGKQPGETLCPCDKKRAEIRREIIAARSPRR